MRRIFWFIQFINEQGEGQPALVQGGRLRKAVARVRSHLGPGTWKLDLARRAVSPPNKRSPKSRRSSSEKS